MSSLEEMIMISLLRQELYGLQIVQAIKDASNGKKSLSAGSLYPALHRLEKERWVKSRWGDDRPEEREGARRRYYKLTKDGQKVLEEQQVFRSRLAALDSWAPA